MAKRTLNKVVWGEGLLVCPQHLQQQDLYYEAVLDTRAQWANAHAWGLVEMEIDPAALKSGEFALKLLRGVMPQGQVLDFDDGDPNLPPARPVGERFPSTAAVCEVYVGVSGVNEGKENYSHAEQGGGGTARYVQWTRDVLDLVDAGTEVPVTFARPKTNVLFGTEARDDFDTIKVAELRRAAGGGYELSQEFVPTALRLSGAPSLRTWTGDLLSAMLTKRRLIVEALAQVDKSRVEFSAQDVTRYLQLGAINRHVPLVRHYTKAADSTPFQLYQALASFAGQLTTFSANIVPEELPTYAHDDMRETFVELFEKLRQLLDLAMQENFIEVPLEARRDGMWIGMLKDPRLADCPQYVVAVEANAPQQEVSNRVPQLSKIASWKQVPRIVHSAIPGAPLTSTHRPPPQIPIRPQSVYFMVDTKHEYWDQILREKTVAIYLPPPFDPSRAKVKLMAIPDPKRSH